MTDACELCTAPTRDGAYACDGCGDTFAKDLREVVEWLADDLETAVGGAKGVRFDKIGRATGGSADASPRVNLRAAELYRLLHQRLSDAVDHCTERRIRHVATTDASAARTVEAMASWLRWRIDGLTLDPGGPGHIGGITETVDRARRLAEWEPPERRFLGPCELCGEGHVYAEGDDIEAICNRCEAAFAADLRRVRMLEEIDGMLFDAKDIARLSTHLGLHRDREKVRKQVNLWHHRKVIVAHVGDGEGAKFLFGDVWRRLVAQDLAG